MSPQRVLVSCAGIPQLEGSIDHFHFGIAAPSDCPSRRPMVRIRTQIRLGGGSWILSSRIHHSGWISTDLTICLGIVSRENSPQLASHTKLNRVPSSTCGIELKVRAPQRVRR